MSRFDKYKTGNPTQGEIPPVMMDQSGEIYDIPQATPTGNRFAKYTMQQTQPQNPPSSKRNQEIEDAANRYVEGGQSMPSTMYQQAAANASKFTDTVGQAYSAVTPDFIENAIGKVAGKVADAGLSLPVAQPWNSGNGIMTMGQAADQMKSTNPELYYNLKATGQLANTVLTALGVSRAANATAKPLAGAGNALESAAQKQILGRTKDYAKNLIRPTGKKAMEEAVPRMKEGGFFKGREYAPTPQETEIIDQLANVKGFGKSNTALSNFHAVRNALGDEAETLKTALAQSNVSFPKAQYFKELEAARQRVITNPALTGDAGKSAMKVIDHMKRIMANKKGTPSDLLEARKELDQWIESSKGGKIFDPTAESGMSIAIKEIRQTTNGFIENKVPSAGVKDSLRKQSNFYNALDEIAPKAAAEKPTGIGRMQDKILDKIPGKGPLAKVAAAAVAATGIGAGGYFLPAAAPVAGIAGAGYGLYKAATSPLLKKGLSKVLKGASELGKKR